MTSSVKLDKNHELTEFTEALSFSFCCDFLLAALLCLSGVSEYTENFRRARRVFSRTLLRYVRLMALAVRLSSVTIVCPT